MSRGVKHGPETTERRYGEQVVSPQKVLVERNREHRVAFESSTVIKYLDFKPVLDLQVEYTKRHLEQGTYFD